MVLAAISAKCTFACGCRCSVLEPVGADEWGIVHVIAISAGVAFMASCAIACTIVCYGALDPSGTAVGTVSTFQAFGRLLALILPVHALEAQTSRAG